MRANFTACKLRFAANTPDGEALRAQWGWRGPVVGIEHNPLTQISRDGCLHLCGRGPDYYPWAVASSTITTWLLPVVGALLQAPFESNATKRTILAITRWVGSPIASLSYILWNIKVSAKAALMVDMAVKYEETPDRRTDFGSMRDSMFLLLAMNQYTLKPTAALREKEAEGLLRIVLFSKDLVLTDTDKTLRQMRRILAREVREMRRRGGVPVFISTMWFLFAFALSIQAAFGNLGANATAHDLALGCLLAWFPVLIMGSIVDRNPIAAEAIRKKLNALVDHVRHALRDPVHRAAFVNSFADQPEFDTLKVWVDDVAGKGEHMYDFFTTFAGQARVRWHYGAAHPILSDIENCYIASKGRNWLANEKEARANLVLGPVNDEGLVWFDVREFWQVASAIIIVGASCGGAFILSFFTPTVGLGCRSGGYTIFFSVALGLLIIEMTVWLLLSPYEVEARWLTRTATRLHSNATFNRFEDDAQDRWRYLKRRASSLLIKTEGLFIRGVVGVMMVFPWKDKMAMKERTESVLEDGLRNLRAMSAQRKWEVFFFRPVETFNTIWLIYIVLAQTFGWYKTCDCVTSRWAGGGGYLDFDVQDTSNSRWVAYYWTSGTVLTALIMGLSMFYITVEWCQQSYISTEHYPDAMAGLRMTRKYRHWTFFFRWLSRFVSKYTLDPLEKLGIIIGLLKRPQKTILWTKGHTWDPPIIGIPPPNDPAQDYHSQIYPPVLPDIALTDFSLSAPDPNKSQTTHLESVPSYAQPDLPHDTPAAPHSLFPPAIPIYRPRSTSDVSSRPRSPSSLSYAPARLSTSDEAAVPLITAPESIHRDMSMRTSLDTRTSYEEAASSPLTPVDVERGGAWTAEGERVERRAGYRRKASDVGEREGRPDRDGDGRERLREVARGDEGRMGLGIE
ncbi:hypothetical protein IQ07DRAFT_684268 [Pyrenochaeta sp. DS3sAY3a]|nr:hypothetical protein IQ07DRAFT_684268 [Pyrenochaeta sp. DS3sAY3a]